ncbi:MAG: dprA [Ramlibacter sp.]|nr:dprA [Ramlibacter sp.]
MESAQDVLEDLRLVMPAPGPAIGGEEPEGEDALLEALGFDPMGLDALIARTGIPAPLLQARLLELELAGEVARLPGGLFQRQARA